MHRIAAFLQSKTQVGVYPIRDPYYKCHFISQTSLQLNLRPKIQKAFEGNYIFTINHTQIIEMKENLKTYCNSHSKLRKLIGAKYMESKIGDL